MAKWVAKLSWSGGQCRLTIPKGLVDDCGWRGTRVVVLERTAGPEITVRRFIDGESLKDEGKGDSP